MKQNYPLQSPLNRPIDGVFNIFTTMFNRFVTLKGVLPLTLSLCLVLVLGVGNVWGQGVESFTNLPTNSPSNYLSRSWTGDDNVTWTAVGARTDQTITGKAICWGNSETRNVISPSYSVGMGNLTFKYSRAFTGTGARSIEVYVNNVKIGNTITVSSTSNNIITYSENINVSGNIVLEIRSTGAAQVKVDDISWTGFSPASNPTLTSPTVSLITTNSATLGATVSSNSGAALTSRGTVWGTTASPTGNSLAEGGTTVATFTHSRTSLTANTFYYYRGYAVNSAGTGYSSGGTFTTLPLAPTVGTGNSITSTGFTANWSHPTMGSASYTYTVEVDDDNAFGSINSTVSSIASSNTSQAITGLSPSTTYYFRVKAVNAQGSSVWSSTSAGVTTSSVATPTLNPVTLASALTSTYGTASTGVSFTASGSNLTGNITATAQSGYEVSTSSGSGYVASVSVASGTTVYVRFASTLSAGTYNNATAVVLSGGGASSNANVTTSSSGNTVSQKALTVTGLTAQNKVYDGLTAATATGTAALSGVVGGDAVSLSGTPTFTFVNASVGNSITVNTTNYSLTGAQASNYSLTQPTLSANITVRSLTITANNVSKVQGVLLSGGAGSTAFTSSGLQNGQTIGSVTISYGSAGATTGDGNTVGVYASQVTPSAATGGTFTASNYSISYVVGSITVLETPITIASWNFNGESSPSSSTSDVSNVNLTSAPVLSRGAGAASSTGSHSFRTTGFQNDGISTSNTDYFQTSFSSSTSVISFATIDAKFVGTTTFYANPGVTSQFAYSFDGTNFTLIGSSQQSTSLTLTQIDLSGISALQNVAAGTTITFRYYASGQTTTGGWGFISASANSSDDGLVIQGYVKSAPQLSTPTSTSIATTSATLGATITSDGGVAITSRGTVYGTSASPTGNTLAEGGTSVAAFSHSRTGLTANTFYYYRGYAVNSVGTGYSADGTFTTLHNAPTVGLGSNATTTTIDASWTAPTGGSATFTYEIEVDDNSDFSSPTFTQSSISSATTSITATGLASNTTYYFRVRANNAGGSSAWSSSSAGYATLEAVSPTLSATALSEFGNVCLNVTSAANSFTINGSALTSADVTVSSLSGYTFSTTEGGTYSSSLTLSQGGGTYSQAIFVKFTPTAVQSYNGNIVVSGGGFAESVNVATSGSGIAGTVSVTTTAASSISTTGASTGGTSVSTTCGTITAKGVAYATTANPTTPTTSDGTGTGNYTSTLSGLTPNTEYNYRAYATNSNGVTNYDSNLTFTTLHNAPTIGVGSGATTAAITANWTAPTGGGAAIFTYEVQISTSSTFATTLTTVSDISSATTSHQFTGLADGTTYYFRVRANNAGGSSAWSAISEPIVTITTWENYEVGSKTGYDVGNVTFNSGSWSLTDALSVSTDANDRKFGTKSIRIRNVGNASMNFDVTNGISTLTIHHALYGIDASSSWRLEVSNNGGSTWDAYVSADVTTSSTTFIAQTFDVDLCGSLRFRIVKRNATGRINFDDIILVEKGTIPNAPAASAQSLCSSATVSNLTATGDGIQWYNASTGGDLLAGGTELSTGTYFVSQTVSGCESARTSVPVTVNANGTWIGGASGDWNEVSNWCGGLPTSSSSVSISSGTTISIDAPSSVLNLTIDEGSTLDFSGSHTLTIADGGSFTNNGTLIAGTGTIEFSGTQTINTGGSGSGKVFHNVIKSGSGTATLAGDMKTSGNVTISGGTFDVSASNYALNVGGDWTNNATFTPRNGTVTFDNTSADQNITGSNSSSFYNLSLSKPGDTLQMLINTNVTNEVQLTSGGILKLNEYSLNLDSTGKLIGESATNYVFCSCPSAQIIASGDILAGSYTDLGNLGLSINPSLAMGQTTVIRTHQPKSLVDGELSIARVYKVTPTVNTNLDASLQFTYFPHEKDDDIHSSLVLFRGEETESDIIWSEIGGTYDTENNKITITDWQHFSPLTAGNGSSSLLPVELLEFKATPISNERIQLHWETATEINNEGFEVQRSTDGISFETIGWVEGNGNSTIMHSYYSDDTEPYSGINYYRLKQVDFDGQYEYSNIVAARLQPNSGFIVSNVRPNPTTDVLFIDIESDYNKEVKLKVFDYMGQIVELKVVHIEKILQTFELSTTNLASGVYFVSIESKDYVSTNKFIVVH